MARTQFFVVKHDDEWKIKLDREHSEPFATQAEEIKAAVKGANQIGENGGEAQVLVQGEDHQFRTTYGNDPYPPAG